MDRFFENALRLFDEDYGERIGWKPAVDMEETKDEFVISAEIPGINKEDINISVSDNKVTISGEVSEERDVQEKSYYLKERVRGKFSRTIALPAPVDAAKAEALYKNGILTLRLSKAEEAKPKEIPIREE